jgi:hypothetical protein
LYTDAHEIGRRYLANFVFEMLFFSVAKPYHFYAAPGKNFGATPASTLLYSKAKFVKRTKV